MLRRRDLKAALQQAAGAAARAPREPAVHQLLTGLISASRDPETLLRLSGDVFFGVAAVRAWGVMHEALLAVELRLLGNLGASQRALDLAASCEQTASPMLARELARLFFETGDEAKELRWLLRANAEPGRECSSGRAAAANRAA